MRHGPEERQSEVVLEEAVELEVAQTQVAHNLLMDPALQRACVVAPCFRLQQDAIVAVCASPIGSFPGVGLLSLFHSFPCSAPYLFLKRFAHPGPCPFAAAVLCARSVGSLQGIWFPNP